MVLVKMCQHEEGCFLNSREARVQKHVEAVLVHLLVDVRRTRHQGVGEVLQHTVLLVHDGGVEALLDLRVVASFTLCLLNFDQVVELYIEAARFVLGDLYDFADQEAPLRNDLLVRYDLSDEREQVHESTRIQFDGRGQLDDLEDHRLKGTLEFLHEVSLICHTVNLHIFLTNTLVHC